MHDVMAAKFVFVIMSVFYFEMAKCDTRNNVYCIMVSAFATDLIRLMAKYGFSLRSSISFLT
jgi:hypothetical protein